MNSLPASRRPRTVRFARPFPWRSNTSLDTRHTPSSQVHLYDRRKNIPLTLERTPELQKFMHENSTIRALRLCSPNYPCRRRICPWCARRVAASTRWATGPIADTFQHVTEITLSTASAYSLVEAWNATDAVRRTFQANGWLTAHSDAWLRETEITHTPGTGWHVHLSFLLLSQTRTPGLGQATIARWLESAATVGVVALRQGQHSSTHTAVHERVRYATKGMLGNYGYHGGHTPADILAAFEAGDADAADQWAELENLFSTKRRYSARGGEFRNKSPRAFA
jgi:hypothetical protein